jgi:Phage portal protein, SPP1 Gp6-like
VVELLTASVLSDDEKQMMGRLAAQIRRDQPKLDRLGLYYKGRQRLEHIGLAVPPELRRFETVVNVPRMAVDEPARRQRIRGFSRVDDSTKEDPALRAAFEFNNLGSQSALVHIDEKIYGRCFVVVGSNEADSERPFITVEGPRHIGCEVDPVRRVITGAARIYRDTSTRATHGTLYQANSTVQMQRGRNGWEVTGRDDHDLGVVPIVMFLNRQLAGEWEGESEMADVIGLTDSIARLATNMQIAAETHAVPARWAAGMSKEDFIDAKTGKMIPTWEAYFTAIKATANPQASFGQFQASDLKNFHESINEMMANCASVLGLPTRFMGQQSVNPAAEGAIRADEARLITNVEWKNTFDGDSWAWVMGLEERFRTGEWGAPNSIRTDWFNAGTPTYSQRADAVVKVRQVGAISIEGMWDEFGWDEARKSQERARLEKERDDPFLAGILRDASGIGQQASAPVGV